MKTMSKEYEKGYCDGGKNVMADFSPALENLGIDIEIEDNDMVFSILQKLLTSDRLRLKKLVEGKKRKCDGEFGCGYDGTQEDRMASCGGPIAVKGAQLHEVIKIQNETLDDILKEL